MQRYPEINVDERHNAKYSHESIGHHSEEEKHSKYMVYIKAHTLKNKKSGRSII